MARAQRQSKRQPKPEPQSLAEPVTRDEALSALGLAGEVNDEVVRAAFRERLKSAHPDIRGGTDALLRRLLMAREMLMAGTKDIHAATELLQNYSGTLDQTLRLDINLNQAIYGGEVETEVPALEVSPVSEMITSLAQTKTLRVGVPAGARSGDIVRVATQGARAEQVFRLHIEAGNGVRVWGDDIWMTARIEARIFALGGLARIETPHGPQDVAIEKDAPRGSSLCLKGLGLPATAERKAGDLHVRLEAEMNRVPSYAEALGAFRERWMG